MESHLRENRHREADDGPAELRDAVEGALGGGKYRILHIDDDADDRALVARELRGEIPGVALVEVESQEQLIAAMRSGRFDLVITDYELCWTNGLEVLRQFKAEFPGTPVIMFTGTGNEEVAVEAMKGGVCDYVLKERRNFQRLRSAVRQALQEVEHTRDLSQAEARYKELFDTVPVGLFRSTPQGDILDANAAFRQMAGLATEEEARDATFHKIHPEKRDFAAWRDKLERDGAVTCVETRFRGNAGKVVWVEIHAKALRDPGSRDIYYEGSVEDITQRKCAEFEREQLIQELRDALVKVRSLTGLLPICSSCKKIRDSGGQWNMLESYIETHSLAHFTHSFCPDCAQRLYPEIFLEARKS
ncbi:MAG TPA: response regulator [Verrucomicrobiae bacterium]